MADLWEGAEAESDAAFALPGDDEILAATSVGQEMAAEDSAPAEVPTDAGTEEVAEGQPRDELGRFASAEGEQPVEEAVAEEPEVDPALDSFLAKYGGDRDKALQGASELNALLARQAEELGELRSRDQQWEQWAQQQEQQSRYQQPAPPTQNWDDLIAEDPARATMLAAQMRDQVAFERAASEWNEISPGAPQAWIGQQQLNARLNQYEQAEQRRTANQAAAELVEKYPEIGKDEVREKIIELAPQYPHEMAALMSGDIQYVVPALESLFLKTRALNSDTLQQQAQEIARIQTAEEIRVREEAAVASATRTNTAPPQLSPQEQIAADWPTDDRLADGWNIG